MLKVRRPDQKAEETVKVGRSILMLGYLEMC